MGIFQRAAQRARIPVSIKHALRTTDCGQGVKHELGIKCGARTDDKTRTRYRTRTTYENRFRKVLLRQTESIKQ